MAYFISCSGEKKCVSRENTKVSNLESLIGFPDLYEARLELIELLNLQLNWNQTLPAYKLYNGKVFKKVTLENWTKKDTRVIIVSALFGLINHDEYIPDYNLIMTDKIPGTNKMISTFWKDKNIAHHVSKENDIDLLFSKYRKAFNRRGELIANEPNILWRDNYGSHKGEWLNQELNLL
jgi:cytoplasmic iron level regulating protein YaaA (DUF328/UPF0246 family)